MPSEKWAALEANLKARYDACEDYVATPSSILLAVLNAVADVNRAPHSAEDRAECSCPEHGSWIAADDVHRLVRELDVALNGEAGAAKQASLCDVVGQVSREARLRGQPILSSTPDTAARVSADAELRDALDRMDAVADPRLGILSLPYDSATVAGIRYDMALIRRRLTAGTGNGVDEAANLRQLAAALDLPEGYEVAEHLPGVWEYSYAADGIRMVSGASWNHPALAAVAAWNSYAEALRGNGGAGNGCAVDEWISCEDALPDDPEEEVIVWRKYDPRYTGRKSEPWEADTSRWDGDEWLFGSATDHVQISHWRRMPSGPTAAMHGNGGES